MSADVDILVVDDEQVILDAVKTISKGEGYSVVTAIDAGIAVSQLDQHRFRIIVSDILMPQMDGFDFLRELNLRWIKTPVIMTTGYSTMENAVKSLYFGAIDFVAKPFTADELLQAIRRALRYNELMEKQKVPGSVPAFVPCPSRYHRLGYASWLKHEHDGSVRIGVTDLMLRTVDSLQGIQLLGANNELAQGNACAFLEDAAGTRHSVMSPVSGQIVEVNPVFASGISILLKDPYFESWFYRVIPSDLEYEMCYLTACSSDRL